MSSVNNTQFIEKEKQRNFLNFFEGMKKNTENESGKSLVFTNCLTGIPAIDLSVNSPELNDTQNAQSIQWLAVKEDADNVTKENMSPLCTNKHSDDMDETDYFDREDEYWESLKRKQIDIRLCSYCSGYHSSRDVTGNILPLSCSDEVYSPSITRTAEKFARDNDFEIGDVYGDGDCLFRAVADQFMINGCTGHTETSLRQAVLKHLEENPEHYGDHTLSSTGNNHITLQALADIFLLQINLFNVINNNMSSSGLVENKTNRVSSTISIFLGHTGEGHYFSLRPLQWRKELPYKAQIYRLLATCTEKSLEERKNLLDIRLAMMSKGCFHKSSLVNSAQYVLRCLSCDENAEYLETSEQTGFKRIFKSYTGQSLQYEETEDSKRTLIEDQLPIDHVSGIPVYHLTFIMKLIFPLEIFYKLVYKMESSHTTGEINFHYLGSFASNTHAMLREVNLTQKIKREDRSTSIKIVVLKSDLEAIYVNESANNTPMPIRVVVDCLDTQPGYCRLRLLSNSSVDQDDDFFRIGSNRFLKPFKIPEMLKPIFKKSVLGEIQCIGVRCQFPRRWIESRGKHNFPTQAVISSTIENGCTLIPKSHPCSALPDIEWKFNFSMAEFLIFESLSSAQMHGFYVLKALLGNMADHLSFKEKHLKNVFLISCEEMTSTAWETNFSGCVLHVLDSLLSCLKAKFLHNYFLPENNLIDSNREEDINKMIIVVEYVRLFPANTIQIVAEKYGYTHARNLIKRVLQGVEAFSPTTNYQVIFDDLFLPLTMATVKILAKMGFYCISYNIIENAFEQSLLLPQNRLSQTSVSFFDIFLKTVMKMKQKSSRYILLQMLQRRTGSNLRDMLKEPVLPLKTCFEWTVDNRLDWIEVPPEIFGDLIAISSFLYECSKEEYWRRNKVLAELTMTMAIRCAQEILKHQSKIVKNDDVDFKTHTAKRKLVDYYKHLYIVSTMDLLVSPLIDYMDDIETLFKDFPEMAGLVSVMFEYVKNTEKCIEYAELFAAHNFGREHAQMSWAPSWQH